jgi:hypothetical protein
LEAAEEEELRQQEAAATAAAAAAAKANGTGSPRYEEVEAAPATKSRWEVMDGDDDEATKQREQEEQRQREREQKQREQHSRQQHPPVPKREQLRFIHPTLAAELDALTGEELERKCRVNGLSNKGSKQLCIERLLALDYYLHADERGPLPSLEAIAAATTPSAAATAAAAGSSHWQSADAAAAGAGLEQPDRAGSGSGRWSSGTLTIPLGGPAIKQEDAGAGDAAAGQQAAAAAAAVAAAASRWQVVDEEAEKQTAPQVPISKWLQEEAAAEEARKV